MHVQADRWLSFSFLLAATQQRETAVLRDKGLLRNKQNLEQKYP